MPYVITTATKKIASLKKRIRGIPGGTSAGKTIGILECLIDQAQRDSKATLTSIVSESFPHLRRGAMRDFESIMKEHRYFSDKRWDKTNSVYTFETGSRIEFFSADQSSKVRGARRDRLFVNEANNVGFSTFEELEVRTKEFVFIDFNPVGEFWWHTEVIPKRTDAEELILTYKDNEGLSNEIIQSIEQRRGRKNWWRVYGLGQLGEIEGRIYTGWEILDDIPHEARLVVRGMDFGYSNDPTVIQDIYRYNGGYIVDERLRQKGMHNSDIARFILNLEEPQTLVVADSAEPKSIDEIFSYGVNITGSTKGQGSVKQGIDFVQSQRVSVTKRSVNTIKSYRNYLWSVDREGKVLNMPDHDYSDEMDAIRYALSSFIPEPPVGSLKPTY